jgi:hypothetical protein
MRQGQTVTYRGPLAPYAGHDAVITDVYTRGLCKGRIQLQFTAPVIDTDGVELDGSLTVAKSDVEAH